MPKISCFDNPLLWLAGLAFVIAGCFSLSSSKPLARSTDHPMNGLTLVAPPAPFPVNPMPAIKAVGANWIATVPYGYTGHNSPSVHFNSSRQWWGERPEGVMKTVALSQQAGIKVMMKPQVWSHGWWTGDYHFDSERDWSKWESDYLTFITYFARLADSLDVDLFCIGTEFKNSIKQRPQFWYEVIDSVRNVFGGQITYAANWDNFENIPFWNALDIVGINAYFPLLNEKTPAVKQLCKAWEPHVRQIQNFHSRVKMPIIFTEYGYLSVDGCAYETWVLEQKINQLSINEAAQANAISALYETFSKEPYWLGGFLWKWFPNMQGHEGYPAKDYTPQGKIAEEVLSSWFSKTLAD